jgi:hypothetical protein
MSRRLAGVLVVLAAAFLGLYLLKRGNSTREHPVIREAFVLPKPSTEERTAFFLKLLSSGKTARVAGASIPVWNVVAEPGLVEGGTKSLDYLLSTDRYKSYRQSLDSLTNVLNILPRFDEAPDHPKYAEFLEHWLDPRNCPRDTPGNRPAEKLRKSIFQLFLTVPPLWSVPYARAELVREDRHHDLRAQALAILLHLGETDAIAEAYPSLPPNAEEPNGSLKEFVLFQMRTGASPNQPTSRRDGVRRLESLARTALAESGRIGRINAASTLLRLGDRSMVDVLLRLHADAASEDAKDEAWSALLQLVDDSNDPRIRAICESRVRRNPPAIKDFTYRTALQILATHWIDDLWVRDMIRDYVKQTELSDLKPLLWLNRAPQEREFIVGLLRDAIHGDGTEERQQAIRFATNSFNPVPEVMPDLLDVARRTPAKRGRTRFLNGLVRMRFHPVRPLLIADLADELPVLRRASTANLLELGGDEAVSAVAERLESGDLAVLAPIAARAKARGRKGIAPRLVPAILFALREGPSEQDRLQALFALRCRGTLDDVRDGLMDAYQREPSQRVADAIRDVLVELAYRTATT